MKSLFVFCIVALIAVARGFVFHNSRIVSTTKLNVDKFVGTLSEIPDGGRKIVETGEVEIERE